MVEIRYPPPTRNISPQFFELKPGTTIQRIFDPTSYGATAINFRYFGALSRFDHQRCDPADVSSAKASVRDAPEGANPLGRSWSSLKGLASRRASRQRHSKAVDEDRGIIYAGFNLSCCLIEVFGDDEEIKIRQQQIAYITLTESVMLLDLRESGAWDAGSTASMPFDGRRKLTQAWSRYFYDNSDLYGSIDGLIFNNAHDGQNAIALYERATSQLSSARILTLNLSDPTIRESIFAAASRLNLFVEIKL